MLTERVFTQQEKQRQRRAEHEVAKRVDFLARLLKLDPEVTFIAICLSRRIVSKFGYVNYAEFAVAIIHHLLVMRPQHLEYDVKSLVSTWNSSREAIGRKPLKVPRIFLQYRRIKERCVDLQEDIDRAGYYEKYMEGIQAELKLPRETLDLAKMLIQQYTSLTKKAMSLGLIVSAIYLAANEKKLEIIQRDLLDAHEKLTTLPFPALERHLRNLRRLISSLSVNQA